MDSRRLREFLSRHNEQTCPDNYYYAWRILFLKERHFNREEILLEAQKDMELEGNLRLQHIFNRDRRKMGNIDKNKWNW